MNARLKKWVTAVGLMMFMLCANLSLAWHAPGHMAVAIIAYRSMDPAKSHAIADVLRQHPDYDRIWKGSRPESIPEDLYLFMRAAVWPDDIRSANHPSHHLEHSTWHYVNVLYKRPKSQPDPPAESGKHISEAMAICDDNFNTGAPAEKAIAICWFMHLIGDIQQPLHATAMVSPDFPKGDRGGNLFWVTDTWGKTNLHSFWDGLWDRDTAQDRSQHNSSIRASDLDILKVEPIADHIGTMYPRRKLRELRAKKFDDWIKESFRAAVNSVYLKGNLAGKPGVGDRNTPPDTPPNLPDKYEEKAKQVGERRVALAGYRLADFLSLRVP